MPLQFTHRLVAPAGVSARELWLWHTRPAAFARLAPPTGDLVCDLQEGIHDGDRIQFHMKGPLGVPLSWDGIHEDYVEGKQFADRMLRGAFKTWRHLHLVSEEAGTGILDDVIDYTMPLGPLGDAFGGWIVRRQLAALFGHRHRTMYRDLRRHQGVRPMRVAVSGASGLVGTALCAFLEVGGHEVIRLVRKEAGKGEVRWDPSAGLLDAAALEGLDGVVHLAGAGIADERWSEARKREILESRVQGTRTLVTAIAACRQPPRAFVSTSAIGWYGDRGDTVLDEDASAGTGFLSEVCQAWEAEARAAQTRTCIVRIGVVLAGQGAALRTLLPLYQAGLGGPIGGGTAWQSFVSLDDLVGLFHHLLISPQAMGVFNGTAPNPVRQSDFARGLGRALGRPACLPAPAFAVRAALGEMSSVALDSTHATPRRTLASGFRFEDPDLASALRTALGMPEPGS